jgi:phosphoglycolate phosphatase-like HAD superfamily hydrolase
MRFPSTGYIYKLYLGGRYSLLKKGEGGWNMITAKAAIFDLDCTLVDTLKRYFSVINELLEERGYEPLSWRIFFRLYVDDALDDLIASPKTRRRKERLHEFWMEYLRRYRKDDPKGKLFPGVPRLFKRLHDAGVPIAVVTSCIVPSPKLKRELAGFGIGGLVQTITTAHDVVDNLERGDHFSKVEIIRTAAERLGMDPRDCVVVGDYWNDIRDAKRLGAKTVGVLSGFMRRELLEKYGPDAIIDGVRDLLKVVRFEENAL